jgi:hypothetical protein
MDQIMQRRKGIALPILACVLVGSVAVIGAIAVAGRLNDSLI